MKQMWWCVFLCTEKIWWVLFHKKPWFTGTILSPDRIQFQIFSTYLVRFNFISPIPSSGPGKTDQWMSKYIWTKKGTDEIGSYVLSFSLLGVLRDLLLIDRNGSQLSRFILEEIFICPLIVEIIQIFPSNYSISFLS